MSNELSNQDKQYIINQKIRFLREQIYNADVDIQLAQAQEIPDTEQVELYTQYKVDWNAKIVVLEAILQELLNAQ
jgi:hypothetical protein